MVVTRALTSKPFMLMILGTLTFTTFAVFGWQVGVIYTVMVGLSCKEV